jgi:hypothetical protein
MKNTLFVLSVFIISTISACNNPKPVTTIRHWTKMIIVSEDDISIQFDKDNDTARVITYHILAPLMKDGKRIKPDTTAVVFNHADIDSLSNVANAIVLNPPDTKAGCTDFVGDLSIRLFYGGYKEPGYYLRSVEYSGVCNWNRLSDKTQQLHDILKKNIHKVYLGEGLVKE